MMLLKIAVSVIEIVKKKKHLKKGWELSLKCPWSYILDNKKKKWENQYEDRVNKYYPVKISIDGTT